MLDCILCPTVAIAHYNFGINARTLCRFICHPPPTGSYKYMIKPKYKHTHKQLLQKAKADANRRERISRDDLLDKLFKCFTRYEYWNLKGLIEETDQPQSWLKESVYFWCFFPAACINTI